jgi:hypothetical protein
MSNRRGSLFAPKMLGTSRKQQSQAGLGQVNKQRMSLNVLPEKKLEMKAWGSRLQFGHGGVNLILVYK